jgi:hypothetical protein
VKMQKSVEAQIAIDEDKHKYDLPAAEDVGFSFPHHHSQQQQFSFSLFLSHFL